jgi:methyl-accepting chemotaxis protein
MLAWITNLRLRWKVLFAPAFLIMVLIGIGAYALHEQRANQASTEGLMAGPIRQTEIVADFVNSAWVSRSHLYFLMATAANETDQQKIKALAKDAMRAVDDLEVKRKLLNDSALSGGKTGEKVGQLNTAVASYIKQARGVIDMADGDSGTALTLMMGATRTFGTIASLSDDLSYTANEQRDRQIALNNSELERQGVLLMIIMSITVVVGCLASFLISRGITKPIIGIVNAIKLMAQGNFDTALPGLGRKDEVGDIASAVEALKLKAIEKAQIEAREASERHEREVEVAARQQKLEAEMQANAAEERAKAAEEQAQVLQVLASGLKRLADGDLTIHFDQELSGAYVQIRDDFNAAVERLRDTIQSIAQIGREVTNATAEISTSTTDLSQRTEEQAASLEQTSASMEQISGTVKKNAENAQAANRSADSTKAVADRGGEVVAHAVDAMAKIEESSRKISDIIGVIDEIARQTNLLALNAAVEAARAGEAGRGFAVVASEVRSLAQRSSQAAKDIKHLITNSNDQVKDGVNLVNKAGTALTEIVESIKSVASIVSDIANASIEQASGIEQVNKALNQMDEVTQQNSALVEENAATAKTLEHQAKAMDERVAFFKLAEAVAPAHERHVVHATPLRGPAAAKQPPAAAAKRAVAIRGGPVGRMQAALATAVSDDADWKEF